MVSKVAVIAIVGILAVPILLGYALNVDQVTETDYKTTGDSVNVTQLLQSGTDYTYAHADVYQLNTTFSLVGTSNILPYYEKLVYSKTSMPISRTTYSAGQYVTDTNTYSTWVYMYYQADYSYSDPAFIAWRSYKTDNTVDVYVNYIHTFYWNSQTGTVEYTYLRSDGGIGYGTYTPASTSYRYEFVRSSSAYNGTGYLERQWANGESYNVDFSGGFHFIYHPGSPYVGETYDNTFINFPNYTKNAIITIDLDSITDPNYSFGIGTQCYIEKTTSDGDVSWQVKPRPRITDNIVPVTDLYYDPTSSNNTYQIKIWVEPDGEPSTVPGYYKYIQHYEFRYVGAWPSLIGEANYYQSYDIQAELIAQTPNFNSILVGGFSARSPVMRVDDAEFRAMEYQVIADKTYDPAAFKTNPATTINDPIVYGPSFTFGGITYAVSKGNITMGSHDIPVKGLVLSSVPNEGGGYDNKIGNTVISTTAAPSAITFNGKWSASISTIAQEATTVTKTEWQAGSFAWDGMDQNFLMVGLLASLGAFIALGIYARRSRASVWPLMIVCGGAALLFFIML